MNRKVADLYDQLHSIENKLGRPKEYPIHKTLSVSQPDITDIYHWIAAEFGLPQQGQILDAGCGVGWGTRYLSSKSNAQVTGISISPAEIQSAKSNNVSDKGANKPAFKLCSFENIEEQQFNLIVAVESIKHCVDLKTTMNSLIRALKPGGRLLLVEDLANESSSRLAKTLCQDWHLTRLYSEQDYIDSCVPLKVKCIDLTGMLPIKSGVLTQLKLMAFNLAFKVSAGAKQYKAFRGGFCLERLYQQRKMRYCALVIDDNRGAN